MAGRKCSVCFSPHKAAAELAVLNGEPQRDIAARFGWTQAALSRHLAAHWRPQLAKVAHVASALAAATSPPGPAQQLAQAMPVLNNLNAIASRLDEIASEMKNVRENAVLKGSAAVAIGAAGAERAAIADLTRLVERVQDAVDQQARNMDAGGDATARRILARIGDDAELRSRLADALLADVEGGADTHADFG